MVYEYVYSVLLAALSRLVLLLQSSCGTARWRAALHWRGRRTVRAAFQTRLTTVRGILSTIALSTESIRESISPSLQTTRYVLLPDTPRLYQSPFQQFDVVQLLAIQDRRSWSNAIS